MALRNHLTNRIGLLAAAAIIALAAVALAGYGLSGASAHGDEEDSGVSTQHSGETSPDIPAVIDRTTITVSGTASRSLTPDQTTIRFSVSGRAKAAQEAVAAGSRALRSITPRLRAAGISDDQLQTNRVSLRQEYDWTEGGRVLLGYLYEQSLTVQIEGTDGAAQLLDVIVSAGGDAVSIDGISFSSSERARHEREVLIEALKDARATADSLAAEIGKQVVDTIDVTVGGGLSPVLSRGVEEAQADAAFASSSVVFSGQDTVTVTVTAVFSASTPEDDAHEDDAH